VKTDESQRWTNLRIGDWMPSVAAGWATCHFAIAWAIVATTVAFRGWSWLGFVLVICWGLPKEFIWDILMEKDTWMGSCTDFFWYCVGGAAAWLVFGVM
jgi:hypothetical protein